MARASRTRRDAVPRPAPHRQPLMPEGAANPARVTPRQHPTAPASFRLYDGHLSAECSLLFNGAPACPACLARTLGAHG